MSVIKNIKKELIRNISAIDSINKVYGFEKVNPDGFPAAFITFNGMANEFFTNAENKRVYTYRVLLLVPIGQDNPTPDMMEQAEQVIQDVTGDILDAMDSDITLDGAGDVVFMEAAVGEPGYVQYEGGQARSSEIQLRVHSVYLV
jgi:hypothetical protein